MVNVQRRVEDGVVLPVMTGDRGVHALIEKCVLMYRLNAIW